MPTQLQQVALLPHPSARQLQKVALMPHPQFQGLPFAPWAHTTA